MAVSVEQTVATLRERVARARIARAARAEATRERLLGAIAIHLGRPAEAWLIGSLAWGDFGERSDIDVVVRGMTQEDATRLELALTHAVGCPIDLLRFEELPQTFRGRVVRDGIVLHGR